MDYGFWDIWENPLLASGLWVPGFSVAVAYRNQLVTRVGFHDLL